MTTSDVRQKIEDLYAKLPDIACQGWCWNSCGPIDMSIAERERIVDLGVEIPRFTSERAARWAANERLYCPALSLGAQGEGKPGCTVYEARPLICRAWGVVDTPDMRCPYGCEIDGEPLSLTEMMAVLADVMRVGGHEDGVKSGAEVEAILSDPKALAALQQYMADPDLRARVREYTSQRKMS